MNTYIQYLIARSCEANAEHEARRVRSGSRHSRTKPQRTPDKAAHRAEAGPYMLAWL